MRALEITINSKKICTAGVDGLDALHAIVSLLPSRAGMGGTGAQQLNVPHAQRVFASLIRGLALLSSSVRCHFNETTIKHCYSRKGALDTICMGAALCGLVTHVAYIYDWSSSRSGSNDASTRRVALQYFFYNLLSLPLSWIGTIKHITKLTFAFTLTCTVALIWEIVEFLSDRFLGTHIQISVEETITDLALGLFGCFFVLAAIRVFVKVTETSRSD